MYTRDSVVVVQPFSRQQEGDEVIIGRAETGVFLAVPAEAVELLEHLAEGKSVGEVSDFYEKKYGEVPDLDDLLSLMEAKGMVAPITESRGGDVAGAKVQQATRRRYHFNNFPQSLARRLFSRTSLVLCCAVVVAALAATVRDPWLAPTPGDLYFPDHRALSWTIVIAATYAAIFVHELGHLIAARAVGISSRIGISHRLWYLVAETDLTGLWSVPKRQRYMPMLAGILIDVVSGASLVLLLFLYRQDWLPLAGFWVRMVRAVAFTCWLRIVWQFFLFVRTDLYYVIATLFNCRNLLADTEVFLRNVLAHRFPQIGAVSQSGIPAAERRMIRIYAVFWLAGRIWAVCVLLLVTLPVGLSYIRSLGSAFRTGYSANPADFADAVVLACYFLAPTIGGLALWIAGVARRERI
jgi:putative peptide zinc metalloprotease protein